MPDAVTLIYCVIVTIETTFICIGNAFAVLVFWKKRVSLRRASYLLLNLAVSDLLVGATELIATATDTIVHGRIKFAAVSSPSIWSIFSALFSTVSLLCLLVISLERSFAVLWPFRHRVASPRAYIISISMVWVAALCIITMLLLSMYTGKVSMMTSSLLINCTFLISLCMILVIYLTIRKRLGSTNPAIHGHNRKMIEQNIKLSKTLFLVIGLSFGLWLPSITMYTMMTFCAVCYSDIFMLVATILQIGNSLVNPIVYSFRMPMFKAAIKKFIVR